MKEKCLVAVSIGEEYNKQTDKMAESFAKHNPDWDICKFYDADLECLLPPQCHSWSAFDKCELGRWIAVRRALEQHQTAVYSDGDIQWYAPYQTSNRAMTLFPHCVTKSAQERRRHFLWKDGYANIGIFEVCQKEDTDKIFEFIIGEVMRNSNEYIKHGTLWLQPIVSFTTNLYDVGYNMDAGYDVAFWNLFTGDREVVMWNGKRMVGTNENKLYDLVSFHFSAKSLHKLEGFGEVVKELKKEYLA